MLAQLLGASLNSEAKVFMTIRDFLLAADGIDDYTPSGPNPGPGYDLWDASYASGDPTNPTSGDWCALRSRGEAGTYPHYVSITFGATYHSVGVWLHWDSERNQGVIGGNNGTNIYHNGAGDVLLYMHADLDELHIIIKPRGSTYYYYSAFGRIKPDLLTYDGSATQAAGAIAAGSGVEIPLASWPAWAEPGRKIYNWDTAGIHELTITAANAAAMTITVDTAWAKAAGSWLAEDLFVYTYSSTNDMISNDAIIGAPSRTGANLAAAVNCYGTPLQMTDGFIDWKYNDRFSGDVWIARAGNLRGRFGLLRTTGAGFYGQSIAWQDEMGRNWRLYKPYNCARYLALREAA